MWGSQNFLGALGAQTTGTELTPEARKGLSSTGVSTGLSPEDRNSVGGQWNSSGEGLMLKHSRCVKNERAGLKEGGSGGKEPPQVPSQGLAFILSLRSHRKRPKETQFLV